MAILKLQLIGVIIYLVANLEAQSPVTKSVTTTTATTAGESSSTAAPASVSNSDNPKNSTAPDQPMPTTIAQPADNGTDENGGYPFVKPGKHVSGPRHMKGHDGFHSLRKEKHWANWNDAFTTPKF